MQRENNSKITMDKLVALCKNRGYIYAGSEIYGGLANTWDYGPLGVEFKNNVKKAWWKKFVRESKYNVGLDSSILLNPQVWTASGHVVNFNDPLIDCKGCKMRHRADKLIEEWAEKNNIDAKTETMPHEAMTEYIRNNKVECPHCNKSDFTDIRKFNMMFKTFQGVTEDSQTELYLRPETAQGIFINFKNIQRTSRKKIPFGIAQIGKSFRNEITPGNFIFRTREFEQMELQFFCKPDTDLEWFDYWKEYCRKFLLGLGIKEENLKFRDHAKEELSHYSKATTDVEYLFPFGWGELWGIADRTDFDLTQHMNHSGENLEYSNPDAGERFIPYVIEPSLGVERLCLVLLCDAYDEEEIGEGDSRVVLRLHPFVAPVKAAVLPLSKKLSEPAMKIYEELSKYFAVEYDDAGSIGKRYRRQDEIGTPFCVTVDFDTLENGTVTVRDRDLMSQIRIKSDELREYIAKNTEF
ncbi:MAG: glycine--tRNA ligase [Oscillospiraceae bacterium]|nr:glycine--tRNA ligase [Oscillospiraceae bacterium]